jgi:hypothetical protein
MTSDTLIKMLPDFLISLAEILLIFSFVFKEILYIRIMSIIAMVIFFVGYLVIGLDVPGIRISFIFNLIGLILNIYQIIILILDKRPVTIPGNLKEIYEANFNNVLPRHFLKIYALAETKYFKKGDIIIEQKTKIDNLMYVVKGSGIIMINGKEISQLKGHFYLGEMSYLTGALTSATDVAKEDMEVLVWDRAKLAKLEENEPEVFASLHVSLVNDVVHKVNYAR